MSEVAKRAAEKLLGLSAQEILTKVVEAVRSDASPKIIDILASAYKARALDDLAYALKGELR